MAKINIILILFVFLFLMGCNEYEKQMPDKSDESISEPQLEKDLTEIKKDGVLNAITIYSSTSYFLYRGQAMGFEYELLTYLAKELGLELKITIAKDIDENPLDVGVTGDDLEGGSNLILVGAPTDIKEVGG